MLAYAKRRLSEIGHVIRLAHATTRGEPDLVACVKGRFVAVECKGPRGMVSGVQEFQLADLLKHAATVAIVRTRADVDGVVERLRGL